MQLTEQFISDQEFLNFLKDHQLNFKIEEILENLKSGKLSPKQAYSRIKKINDTLEPEIDIPLSQAIIRPTGLIDPKIILKPVTNQVDDVLEEVRKRVKKGQRVLITTLTKKFAEELDIYFKQINIKSAYIHSDVETLDRIDILSDLRRGKYDVLIGINLLREGLDLPEVSLVAIFDADKEGFLRSKTSLIQIIGRAARHVEGTVIMYANTITESMRYAISETDRRRDIQTEHNHKYGIIPTTVVREIQAITDDLRKEIEKNEDYGESGTSWTPSGFEPKRKDSKQNNSVQKEGNTPKTKFKKSKQVYADFDQAKQEYISNLKYLSKDELEEEMQKAVGEMDFEKAAAIRDLLK